MEAIRNSGRNGAIGAERRRATRSLAAGWLRRFLAVGTFWKILLANALVVAGALLIVPDATHALELDRSSLAVLVIVTFVTLLVNAAVLRLALAPLVELETAAERVAAGDLAARARPSPLADRPLARLTSTFNRMVENVQSERERVRSIASRTVNDAEQSNRRLSHDLREDTAQTLAMVLIRLRTLKSESDAAVRDRVIDDLRESIGGVISQVQSFAGRLRPSTLDLLGADAVIEAYATAAAERAGRRLAIEADGLRGQLAPETELGLLRLVQEGVDRALANARDRVCVTLRRRPTGVVAVIEDDGAPDGALDPDREAPLFAMQERASYFGGSVRSARGSLGGPQLTIHFPPSHTV